jgi:GT2 family glycosyltransferase
MVGSCLVQADHPEVVASRGLAWRKWQGRPLAVDRLAPIEIEPDATEVEARLWAPSGASIYATRRLINEIGLMDEHYFLYFEDLEWGDRARRRGGIGYAHRSVVRHKQGTTTGSASSRAGRSPLSVYLGARNTVLFVRACYPLWLPWTLLMQALYLATYGAAGAFANMVYGLRGLLAGLRGETGRPDALVARHRPKA